MGFCAVKNIKNNTDIIAIIFPGQGVQKRGMISDLFQSYELIRKTFEEASAILNYDLWELIKYEKIGKLNNTIYAQLAILVSSVAIWRLWKKKNNKIPNFMAGHSLGEYSALVCSGSLKLSSALKLVYYRGKFMKESIPKGGGAMAAVIGLKRNIISKICDIISNNILVFPANFNSMYQTVISGHNLAVEKASYACKSAGAKSVIKLPIEIPSHCILMKSAAKKLAKILKIIKFKEPKIPVVNNVNSSIDNDPYIIKRNLIKQLYYPVNWIEINKFLVKHGVNKIYEIGPGNVLSKITKDNIKNIYIKSINSVKSIEDI